MPSTKGDQLALSREFKRLFLSLIVLAFFTVGVPRPAEAQRPSNSRLSGSGVPIDAGAAWVQCWAEYQYDTSDFYWVEVFLKIKDENGNLVASDFADGWWYAYAEVTTDLTYTSDYRCEAEYFVNGNRVGGDSKSLGVFLTVLDITINTFIPFDNARDPIWSDDYTWDGDGREFQRNGSSRTAMLSSIFQPTTPWQFESWPYAGTGLTQLFDVPTSLSGDILTAEARADWDPGPPKKIDWAQSSGGSMWCSTSRTSTVNMTLECHQNESNPLLTDFGWFGITYDFYVDFWFYEDGRVEYLVRGEHDGFPNYEIYVGDQLLYSHDARPSGQTLWSLGRPCEYAGLFVPGVIQ
jgi:hypothetical protein